MAEFRESMWTAALRNAIESLRCPWCGEQNLVGKKPMIELTNGQAFCNKCSHVWVVNQGDPR